MKRKPALIFLVIVISAFIAVLPAYYRCSNLKRAKLLSTNLSFESLDKENLLIDRQKQSKVFVSSAFFIIFHLGTNVFEHISYFSYPTFSLDQASMILRC
jgi:hypothetical protein